MGSLALGLSACGNEGAHTKPSPTPASSPTPTCVVRLLDTGQTMSYGSGSDGDLRGGAAVSYTDNGDGTITDNRTGLMWEKKDDSTGIHGRENLYTWGVMAPPFTMNGTIVTTFLHTLNSVPCLAGYCDWRIPNVRELQSIVRYGTAYPSISEMFHNPDGCAGCSNTTLASCSCTGSGDNYWSSTTFADNTAWFINFDMGFTYLGNKDLTFAVRAVRGGRAPRR